MTISIDRPLPNAPRRRAATRAEQAPAPTTRQAAQAAAPAQADGTVPAMGLGGILGAAGSVFVSSALRATPGGALIGAAIGFVGGAVAGAVTLRVLQETPLGRHPRAAIVGSLLGGGLLAMGALTVGIASGPIVAVAGIVGGAAGAYGLARGLDAVVG